MTGKIVLVTAAYGQADILGDYLQWYLDLGVDTIIVMDMESRDGSQKILDEFQRSGKVFWMTLPDRNMKTYSVSGVLFSMARDQHNADWIIFCDADEFLCVDGGNLRQVLQDASDNNCTLLSVPCLNMTGPHLETGQSATQNLTLRIDKPVIDTLLERLTGYLRVPQIFIRHLPKTIVRASAHVAYGFGTHSASVSWGKHGTDARLRLLHYPVRSFDALLLKTRNTEAWLKENPRPTLNWGWDWRRRIRLNRKGKLRHDYNKQFVSPARAEELVRKGVCSVDNTVAIWSRARRNTPD